MIKEYIKKREEEFDEKFEVDELGFYSKPEADDVKQFNAATIQGLLKLIQEIGEGMEWETGDEFNDRYLNNAKIHNNVLKDILKQLK